MEGPWRLIRGSLQILGKKPPYGSTVQDFVMHLPKYVLQTFVKVGDGVTINLNVRLENALQIEGKCSIDRNSYMVLLVGDSFGNIFFYEKYSHDYMIQNGQISKSFIVSNSETHEVRLHFISQTFGKLKMFFLHHFSILIVHSWH